MIRVTRGDQPQDFEYRRAKWESAFQNARIATPKITSSKFWSTVRTSIRSDAEILAVRHHRKCAFCESKMEHVMAPHVEHYRPKSQPQYEALMFDWTNWLLSCGQCNTKKGRHFDDAAVDDRIIDPVIDNPSEHVAFAGHLPIAISSRGAATIRAVGLDRLKLNEQRHIWLAVIGLLLVQASAGAAAIKPVARRFLIWCMQDEAPYSAMVRAFIARYAPKLAHPELPHSRVDESDLVDEIKSLLATFDADLAALI